ncbi:MAG: FHA domain-containing protein, partial [Chloroflexaceae bacterium]|nr:FHA domain-containing protein [Chloroflexaceae bacterium]
MLAPQPLGTAELPKDRVLPPLPTRSKGGKTRAELEAEIQRHRNTITQMEQIIGAQGGTAPAYLTTALEDARRALKVAEDDMATVSAGPDPAEVARLEEEIQRHRNTIVQMEQIIGAQGGTAPAYLATALEDARQALTRAETELSDLRNGPAPSVAPQQSEATTPATLAEPTTEAETPQPRLVLLDSGRVLKLPEHKTTIIVGREDPVSMIFPEIDLTPFGGESGGVSRQHAQISNQHGQWSITDLNSTNYTKVDGRRVEPNVSTPLHDRTHIQFGRIAVEFRLT